MVGASILNFNQRDIVKTRRNCFFPYVLFSSMWQQQHTYLLSTLVHPSLHPRPAILDTQASAQGYGSSSSGLNCFAVEKDRPCFEYQALSLVVLLYPFLADQYTTLSLNIRLFQTNFSVFYFTFFFSLNGFSTLSREEQIAATYLRLCLVHVDILV